MTGSSTTATVSHETIQGFSDVRPLSSILAQATTTFAHSYMHNSFMKIWHNLILKKDTAMADVQLPSPTNTVITDVQLLTCADSARPVR